MKFYRLGFVVEVLESFGSLDVLDALLREKYEHVKCAYQTTSQKQSSGMLETVCVVHLRRDEGLKKWKVMKPWAGLLQLRHGTD